MLLLDPKYLQKLVESSPDMIIAVDREGTIAYYNDGARTNLQYSSDEVIGQKVTKVYPTVEEAKRVMKALRDDADHHISSFETVFRNKNNEEIPVMISGSIIYDESGAEAGSIGFARDIRRMRARDQLVTAGEIAVSLAHEINNPLENIINNLDLLSRSVDEARDRTSSVANHERIDSIRGSVKRVQAIIRRLDEMARKGVYETRAYMEGRKMADLAPRETAKDRAEEVERKTEPPHGDWPIAGMAVMVLDDDNSVVNSLADLLRAERCVVYTATRPSNALGILRNVKVDAIISDVVMPEMDGYDFYMRVRQEMPDLPVILMTAYYYDKDHIIKRSKLRGLEGAIFKKPVNPGKLRTLLASIRLRTQASRPAATT